MEAPNKIYLHPDIGGREFIRPWLRRAANSESVAYVRIDALIDILNEEKDKTIIGICEYDTGLENGRMEVIETLLQKIKAL